MEMLAMCVGSFRTNCYMLWQGEECVLVDPGFEPEQILEQVLCKGKKVAAILLTHGHFDHVGGVKHIAAETGCPVYIHEADIRLPSRHTDGQIYHTHTYDEGDVLEIAGMTFRVLHTPGHTPGSIALLERDKHLLISGDSVQTGSIYMFGAGRSLQAFRASMGKLIGIKDSFDVAISSHNDLEILPEKLYELESLADDILKGNIPEAKSAPSQMPAEVKIYGKNNVSFFLYEIKN